MKREAGNRPGTQVDIGRVVGRRAAARIAATLRRRGARLVFTNGVFDLLHVGHLDLLEKARALGDALVVGVNSDASVRRLKGRGRPIVPLRERMEMLAGLKPVDYVVAFGEDTPARIIAALRPAVLVKGADYRISDIVGADTVQASGGRVVRVRLKPGRSTTGLVARARIADRARARLAVAAGAAARRRASTTKRLAIAAARTHPAAGTRAVAGTRAAGRDRRR